MTLLLMCLNNKPPLVTSFLYDTCKLYGNDFTLECSIQNAESEEIKRARLGLSKATSIVVKHGLSLLGIEAPERM